MTHRRTLVIQTLLLAILVPALVGGQGGILPVNCTSGNTINISATGVVSCVALPSGALPTGFIGMIVSGTCPAGTTEESSLNGKTLFGTLAANGDVGTTGGADTITPTVASLTAAAQTVNSLTAAAQTVNSLTAAAQAFTGSTTTVPALAAGTLGFSGNSFTSVINHTHGITGSTASGTTGITGTVPVRASAGSQTANVSEAGSTGGTSTTAISVTDGGHTHGVGTLATSNPAGGVASITPTGSITGSTATGSLVPLGSNAASAVTGTMNSSAVTGTMNSSAVTGTLNSFDNRSAFTKVIFCKGN